ncbi:MAG: hypothetical protein AB1511_09340 [Deinococcota bacterium]
MRKPLPVLALPLLLAACGSTGPNLGQGFEMTAALTGTQVAVDVVNVYAKNADGSPGAYLSSRVDKYTPTAGTLKVEVRGGSLGFTAQKVTVKYTDASGNPLADTASTFNNSVAFTVPGGYTCPGGATTCAATDKTLTATTFSLPDLYWLSEQAALMAARGCVDGSSVIGTGYVCPEVRMNVTFTGKDSLGAERTLTIPQAQVRVYVNSVSDEVR